MKLTLKNIGIAFIIIFLAVVGIKKMRKPHRQPVNGNSAIRNAVPAEVESPVPLAQSPASRTPSPLLKAAPVAPVVTQLASELDNPFCLKNDFVIIPSIYLRGFYYENASMIALPQSFANCFQKNKDLDFVFFEYQGEHQIPWLHLVGMRGRIKDIKSYVNFADLKKNSDFAESIIDKSITPLVYQNIGAHFQPYLNVRWVVVSISRDSIEDHPAYWPEAPKLHPVAEFISVAQFNELKNRRDENLIFLDVRSKHAKEEFKLPFQTIGLQHFKRNFGAYVWEPSQLAQIKFFSEHNIIHPQSRFVVIAGNSFDVGAINAANFLTEKGYRSIYILKEGAAGLGGPPARPLKNLLHVIDVDGLKRMLESEPQKTLVVDCRVGGQKHILIPNSVTVQQSEAEDGHHKIDITPVSQMISKLAPHAIVFVGHSDHDNMPEQIASMLSEKGTNFYKLRDGFKAWKFYSNYKWDAKAKKILHRTSARAHMSPPHFRTNNPIKAPIRIDPVKVYGPRVVKPQRVRPEEIEQIKRNNRLPSPVKH